MNLLKRYESDDFDESYDFGDPESGDLDSEGSSKPFLVKAAAMIMAVTGIAYGANIAIGGNNGTGAMEFGQGIITTSSACDTNDGITVTPYAGYINQANGTGKFTLDSIIFENVDANCEGVDFIVQVWSDSGATSLTSSETATGGSYTTANSVRFHFQDSSTVTMMSNQYTDIELMTDTDPDSTEFTDNQSAFQLVFDPDQASSFADASQVYKITLMSVPHTPHD